MSSLPEETKVSQSKAALRILGIVEGDPAAPLTLSGVPAFLLNALGRRFDVIGSLNYGLHGWRRARHAVTTFRPQRSDWVARFHLMPRAHRALTATLREQLQKSSIEFDIAFQIHGWVGGQPRPYCLYVDQTRAQIEASWPRWMPMGSRARAEGRRLEQRMYHGACHIFVMGEPARASLQSDYGIEQSRVTTVGGGLNFLSLPAKRTEPAPEPRILFLGRDFERKGGEVLLEAFRAVRAQIPNATLHIVGATRRITDAGVTAYGVIKDRTRVEEQYRRARVVCAPSLYEPWGFAFMEAMAHSLPCVGTTVQSVPDILDRGRAGLLVPPSDSAALAEAIVTLLRDDSLAMRLGERGRTVVEERYTWDQVVEAMVPALTSLRLDGDLSRSQHDSVP